MDDLILISRKAAIYAMNEVYRNIKMIKKRPVNKTEQAMYLDMIGAVKSVPFTQTELIEKAAYIRGFEQGRTQGMIDRKAEEVAQSDLQPTLMQNLDAEDPEKPRMKMISREVKDTLVKRLMPMCTWNGMPKEAVNRLMEITRYVINLE